MSARNPLPKINQFNSPKCPRISKPWTRLRWNLSFMPKVAGEIRSLRTFGAPDDPRQTWDVAVTYSPVKNSLWKPLCPCQWRHPAASAGERARSPWVLVLARAQLHHFARPEHVLPAEGNTMNKTTFFCLLPTLFPAAVSFKQNQILFNEEGLLFFFASSCRLQFVNST